MKNLKTRLDNFVNTGELDVDLVVTRKKNYSKTLKKKKKKFITKELKISKKLLNCCKTKRKYKTNLFNKLQVFYY